MWGGQVQGWRSTYGTGGLGSSGCLGSLTLVSRSVHSVPQCLDCGRFNTCRECLQHLECGWCGDADNPTLGR